MCSVSSSASCDKQSSSNQYPSAFVAGSGTAYGAHELAKQQVTISINGKKQDVRTNAETVGELLKSLDIETRKEDHIYIRVRR